MTTVHSGDEDFRGVTYDPLQAKLYWSSNTKIYRGNMDGSEDTVVLNTTLCKHYNVDSSSLFGFWGLRPEQ